MNKHLGDRPFTGRTNSSPRRSVRSRTVSPFVGRDEELRRLAGAFARAVKGQGSTIFLAGQPGVGKTRLAHEALAKARERGVTVLEGRAFPSEVGLAYAPLIDAFRPMLRNLDPDRLQSLVSGLPILGHLFDGLIPPATEPLSDPALERTRIFESMCRLLERLSQEAPVAFFIDDVHWADPATIEFLHYLARSLSSQQTILLATYSDDASENSRNLRRLIGMLERDGFAEELVVPRLGPDGVDKLVEGILDGKAPSDLLALLDVRTEGMPLFIEALIEALIDSGNLVRGASEKDGWSLNAEGALALPPSVRRLVLGRLERLAPTDRRILDLIAIMGDATPHIILHAASGLNEETLLDALIRLESGGFVSERMEGLEVAYSIAHPLIQEVAYAELPEMVRRRGHIAAIEAIERLRPDDVNRLAHHYRAAGPGTDCGRALAALVAAGDRALAIFANEEAVQHLEAALAMAREGLPSVGSASGDEALVCSLLERLGRAWRRMGKHEAAAAAWGEALAKREQAGDVITAAHLHSQLALAEWDWGGIDNANTHLKAGLVLLKEGLAGGEPCQELVNLNFARFHILGRLGDISGMAETTAELLTLAGQLATPRAEAKANVVAALFSLEENDVTTARERALRALLVGEQTKDLAICCEARSVLVVVSMRQGDHHSMRYHAERGLAVAQHLGTRSWEVFLRLYLADTNFISGDWNQSLQCLKEATALAHRVGDPRHLGYSLPKQAMILAYRGDLLAAKACICEARIAFGSGIPVDRYVFGLINNAEVTLALEQREAERALDIARGSFRPSESVFLRSAPVGLAPPHVPMGLILLAEAQVAAGDPESALETARNISSLDSTGTPYLTALASRAEGLARQALDEHEAAIACLARAHQAFTDMGMPFEAARCLLEQATAMTDVKPESALKAAQQSLATFERLDAQRYSEHARRLLGRFGISPIATLRPRLRGIAVSERELEIARLVAQGLTTAEIGKRLQLSPLTISAHLRRIYSRLGIGSRTSLARLVMEAGLLQPESGNYLVIG